MKQREANELQGKPVFEQLEQRLLLSSVPVIESISSLHDGFRFIAATDLPSVENTYQAQVTGTASSVTFNVGGMELIDSDDSDGWSATFDMTFATTTDQLTVTASGPDGSDVETHSVDILLLPDWFHADDVDFLAFFCAVEIETIVLIAEIHRNNVWYFTIH